MHVLGSLDGELHPRHVLGAQRLVALIPVGVGDVGRVREHRADSVCDGSEFSTSRRCFLSWMLPVDAVSICDASCGCSTISKVVNELWLGRR